MMHRVTFYLADGLSLVRAITSPLVLYFSWQEQWTLAFGLLVFGWVTDVVDGAAARKFGSWTGNRGIDADGIADSLLAFGASLVPVLYAGSHFGWLSPVALGLDLLYILTVISAIWMVLVMNNGPGSRTKRFIVGVNMIVMHGIIQIGATTVWFAYMASGFGLVTMYAVAILLCVPYTQRRKIALWLEGRLT